MSDRVRMKSKTVFNNPLIISHESEPRADAHTVIEDDEFSTSEAHAIELEAAGFAERIKGDAAELSPEAEKLLGSQTSNNDAIASNRVTKKTDAKPVETAA